MPTFTGLTGVLYTIPSIAFFLLLLPITGRGTATAIIALTLYTLQIIYRNIITGLANVPAPAKDSGRGMGMTDRQLLWRVELPLAVPEIIAGLRIATVSTVAIATLAFFAGSWRTWRGDLQRHRLSRPGSSSAARSRSRWRSRSTPCYVAAQRRDLALAEGAADMSLAVPVLIPLAIVRRTRSRERSTSSSERQSGGGSRGGNQVGGLEQVGELLLDACGGQRARARRRARDRAAHRPLLRPPRHRGAARGGDRQRRPRDPRAGADRLHGGVHRGRACST